MDESPQQGCLALAIVSHDCSTLTMFNFKSDLISDNMVWISNGHPLTPDGRALPRIHSWCSHVHGGFINLKLSGL